MCRGDQLIKRIALAARRPRDLALKVLVAEAGKRPGIIEDLADHFAPGLRVTPQLAFDDHQCAARIDQEGIDPADLGDIELARDRHQRADPRIDLADREHGGMGKQQVAQRIFAPGFALRHPRDDLRGCIRTIQKDQGHRLTCRLSVTRHMLGWRPKSTPMSLIVCR